MQLLLNCWAVFKSNQLFVIIFGVDLIKMNFRHELCHKFDEDHEYVVLLCVE
jgi:hypothetical protein